MPLTVRFPSMMAFGRAMKLSFTRTMSATLRAAPLPLWTATPTWAFLMERTSFIPSPTMATYLSFFLRVSITFSFCSGRMRPKMFVSTTVFSYSSGDMAESSSPEIIFLSPGMSAILNMASTVSGSSPDMTLMSIPFSENCWRISLQSGLTSSIMDMTASTVRSGRTISSPLCRGAEPPDRKTTERSPLEDSAESFSSMPSCSFTWSLRKGHAPMMMVS